MFQNMYIHMFQSISFWDRSFYYSFIDGVVYVKIIYTWLTKITYCHPFY